MSTPYSPLDTEDAFNHDWRSKSLANVCQQRHGGPTHAWSPKQDRGPRHPLPLDKVKPSTTTGGGQKPGKCLPASPKVPNAHGSRLSHVHALLASGHRGHAFNHDWRRSKAWQMHASIAEGPGNEIPAFNHTHAVPKVPNAHRNCNGGPTQAWSPNLGRGTCLTRHTSRPSLARLWTPKPGKCPRRHTPASIAEDPGIETTFGLPIERRQRPRSTPKPRRPSSTLREVPVTDRRATSTVKAHTTYHTRVCHDYGLEGVF